MLSELKLQNFRGFSNHRIPLKDLTVIVGKNNAGKTTLVEAFRLISIVVSRYKNLQMKSPPAWTDLPRREYGVSPSIRNLEINFEGLFHRYDQPPAVIEGVFSNGPSVTVYLNETREIHAILKDPAGKTVRGKGQTNLINLPLVSIMPQVAPVQRNERILTRHYVQSAMSSALSPLHFRNQLNLLFRPYFGQFRRAVEDTWPGVRVMELIGQGKPVQSDLNLLVRNEDFVGEVSLMGHGLQMWLQTMWFLTRSDISNTVILDEPDVYMHPDLQRRVIRFLRNRFPQTILTTHSTEIMSEVDPDNILVVDKSREQSDFATSLPAVQKITDNIGSVHNVHLTRLWSAKKLLLLEGKDLRILKQYHDLMFPNSSLPLESIPHIQIGGWSGWSQALGSSLAMQNAFGEKIQVYCILDRDYFTESELNERYRKAREFGFYLHIWSQKEIENFSLVPSVVHRYIKKRVANRTKPPSLQEVYEKIESAAWAMEQQVFDSLSTEINVQDRRLGLAGSNKAAREYMKPYKDRGSILPIVSGKKLVSTISGWAQSEFGVQINAVNLTKEFYKSDINEEIVSVLTAIERHRSFK